MSFVLAETPAGYALLKARNKKLYKSDSILDELASVEKVVEQFRVKAFEKFESAAQALEEINSIVESKVSKKLVELLDTLKSEKKASLIVSDPKLGNAINKLDLKLNVVSDSNTLDIFRAIRENLPSLLPGLGEAELGTMSLGLAHSLGRHKLRFSPDKVDVMIIQAIALLDDLDKEINVYAMRLKEWYGWHFPELTKIVSDNMAYAETVKAMGFRSNAATTDFSSILPDEVEQHLKDAAEISMGTEITESDLRNINIFADQVINLMLYRDKLSSYLNNRMAVLAPNLTALVGELVGARLISHAGSIMNLAKAPASTLQILGAEKALFRALKTKHDTPKYGIMYYASLVGQASGRNKGKIARMLAAKASVSIRVDALAENDVDGPTIGAEDRVKVERRLAQLEGRDITRISANSHLQPKAALKTIRQYNTDADATMGDADSDDEEEEELPLKRKREGDDNDAQEEDDHKVKKEKKEKKEKKHKKDKKEKSDKKDKKEKKSRKDSS